MDFYSVVALLTFIIAALAILVIRKPKEYTYTALDTSGIILNFVLGVMVYPPLTVIGQLLGIAEFATEPLLVALEQAGIVLGSLMPAVSVGGIGASVVLRRKGRRGLSFAVQFAGLVCFALAMLLAGASGSI